MIKIPGYRKKFTALDDPATERQWNKIDLLLGKSGHSWEEMVEIINRLHPQHRQIEYYGWGEGLTKREAGRVIGYIESQE